MKPKKKKQATETKTTETKAKSRRPDAVDYTKFAQLWKTSTSVSAVAKALGIKTNSASAIASRLRGEGVELRKFPRRPPQKVDVKKLNQIARAK